MGYKGHFELIVPMSGDVRQLITGRSQKIWRMATRSARIAGMALRKSWSRTNPHKRPSDRRAKQQ
jgi:hypothetical protein